MERVKLLVLIPVGPACELRYVEDTIRSVVRHTTTSRLIVVLDDSGGDCGAQLRRSVPEITVLRTPTSRGVGAGLYLTLSMGFQHAVSNCEFEVALRLDTDALVIGENPEEDAISFFRQHPEFGLIGSHKTYSDGQPLDTTWPRARLARETALRSLIKHPRRLRGFLFLRRMVRAARRHGYEMGDYCFGSSFFASGAWASQMHRRRLFARDETLHSKLASDVIFGLLTYAAGFRIGDFSTGTLPMGLAHRELPFAPDELLIRHKKIIHSTRSYRDLDEEQIRAWFRRHA